MKKTNSRGLTSRLLKFACIGAATVLGISSCKQYDLDERMPEWLGESIYDYLEENGYDTYVKLIDDLGYHDVMSKTGSKTLFVADEAAVARFYATGTFKKNDGTPVKKYEDLSNAQKKMLLYGAMLNNVYQVAMLSSSEGPVEGDAMRRLSATSIYDTVRVFAPEAMPNNPYWKYYKDNNKKITVIQDATLKPMVFFVNKFLTTKKITNDDYDFLFNQGKYSKPGTSVPGREPADASVNGTIIKEQNIKCLNGFVHVMAEVIYPLPNMGEYLSLNPNTKIYDAILERFSAPYWNETATNNYNRLYPNAQVDSIFEKRFFADRSRGAYDRQRDQWVDENPNIYTPDMGAVPTTLKFDPGWNAYYASTSATTTSAVALQQNMGVMLVPDDKAMSKWWVESPLKTRFGKDEYKNMTSMTVDQIIEDMAGVPDLTIVKLLNNNMLNSFTGSVPSKFISVLDDANDPMGLTTNDVDSVKMCCNGAIYFTNKVFSPTAYRSVSFPALVNENLQIINWAIDQFEFNAYLNSMVATYSLFIPSVSTDPSSELYGKMAYLDPVSQGKKYTTAFVFRYDETAKEKENRVRADIYDYDAETGTIDFSTSTPATADQIKNRLEDLLDYHIVIGDVEARPSEWKYFQTKGRGTVKFETIGGKQYVSGGYQLEKGTPLEVIQKYDMKLSNGNGVTYVIEEPLLTSSNAVYDVLADATNYPEFQAFFKLMTDVWAASGTDGNAIGSSFRVNTFNTYHYTVYVPTKASLDAMIAAGDLMDGDAIDAKEKYYDTLQDNDEAYTNEMIALSRKIRKADPSEPNTPEDSIFQHTTYISMLNTNLQNFVKYHIQDNSVYYGSEFKIDTIHTNSREANYETAYMRPTGQFAKLAVRSESDGIYVGDAAAKANNTDYKNWAKVVTTDSRLCNIMCREYEYKGAKDPQLLETSSYAVIHLIDKPLSYFENGEKFDPAK
ncbi:MAG: hypothetical protein MJY79_01865 [Bacteroidaceae bacterium]|nr:hypothetical protein [Bacteroidaceae bacterium]